MSILSRFAVNGMYIIDNQQKLADQITCCQKAEYTWLKAWKSHNYIPSQSYLNKKAKYFHTFSLVIACNALSVVLLHRQGNPERI